MLQDYRTHLPHLVHLRLAPVALEVDPLFYPGAPKKVMATPRSFLKPKVEQERAKILKADVRVGRAAQDLEEELLVSVHALESAALRRRTLPCAWVARPESSDSAVHLAHGYLGVRADLLKRHSCPFVRAAELGALV